MVFLPFLNRFCLSMNEPINEDDDMVGLVGSLDGSHLMTDNINLLTES